MAMSKADVRAKIEWEGGIVGTLNYGLKDTDIADPKLASLWAEAMAIHSDLESVIAEINEELRS